MKKEQIEALAENKTAKQQAVEAAWSKYDHEVYSKNGFCYDKGAKYDIWNGDFELVSGMHRPISLKGIETNNGWIRINSEEDLPEIGKYRVFVDGRIEKATLSTDNNWYNPLKCKPTHYKPITPELNPIY